MSKFTPEQTEIINKVYTEIQNQTEAAVKLTEQFGFRVTRQNVAYHTGDDGDIPMSEDRTKILNATLEECIANLQRVANVDTSKVISRNYFREHSVLAESAWSVHFGTFSEFKKQAGVTLTRHAQRMERNVAKHASVDTFRAMNDEKRAWSAEYLKPNNAKFQTVMVCSDLHDVECDPFWRYLWFQTLARVMPTKVVLNGDIFDLAEFGSYGVDPREWDIIEKIHWVHDFLEDIRHIVPDAEIIFIEGNHEYRLLRHLSEATPAMKAVLSDLHGFTVPKLLGLDAFEVNYVAPADLAVFTKPEARAEVKKNWTKIHDCLLASHYPQARRLGMPGWNGHHHKHLVYSEHNALFGTYEWHQLGGGHKREASYCDGAIWGNGFLLAHVNTESKSTQFEYIDTTYDHVVIGGKWYERND